jgi:cobalt-zinc-cadmium efflux system outer membrane protein
MDAVAELARATNHAATISIRTEGMPLDEAEAPAGSLTLAEAVRLALHSSAELQAALSRVRIAEAEADQTRLLPNPILDVVLRFPSGGGGTQFDAGIAENLFGVLSRPRRTTAAEDRLAATVAEAVSVALDVVAEVRERHASAQAQDELAALVRERRVLLERLLDVARARLEAGYGTRLDVTTLETQAIELDLEVEEREAGRRRERLSLARLIGRPSEDASWDLSPRIEPPALPVVEGDWIARALEDRPEIQSLRWKLAAQGEEIGLARWLVLAETDAGLDFEREEADALGPAVSVPLPLFDQGDARRRRAAAAWMEARNELIAAQRKVVEEVRRALSDLETARARLTRVQDRLLPLELERRSQVEEVFLSGQVDVTALLFAEQSLQAALKRRVELATELVDSWSRLERAVGGAGPVKSVVESGAGGSGARQEP